jgi:uncharacterized membrane protein YhaH (DUF805 family)
MENSELQLKFHRIENKNLFVLIWLIQNIIFVGWFFYIYGVLGHVCPVAFLGVWASSMIASVAITNRRPRFLGAFISFIITAGLWYLAFFEFHEFDEDNLAKNITREPYYFLILTIILVNLVQIVLSKGEERQSNRFELVCEKVLTIFGYLVGFFAGLIYITVPTVKDAVWNDKPEDWFDTVFEIGEIYYLFLFIAVIGLFAGVFGGIALITQARNDKKSRMEIISRLLAYTFLGLIFLGAWGLYVYLGTPEISDKDTNND